jgi:hypothetical protein
MPTPANPDSQKINICCLAKIFHDVAESTRFGFYELGFDVCVNSGLIISDRQNIIFGGHMISDFSQIPLGSVIVNFEQLGSDSILIREEYINSMRAHQVWDYSVRNIEWLAARGVVAKLLRLGYSPYLTRIHNLDRQDIDVLFYGALNERRVHILQSLQKKGLSVVAISSGMTGSELDEYISRSKVVLNLHYYSTHIFEIVRVSYLLCNRKAVVAEVGISTEIEPEIKNAVLAVPYEQLINACCDLVGDEEKRRAVETRGWDIFSNRAQVKLLNELLGDGGIPPNL